MSEQLPKQHESPQSQEQSQESRYPTPDELDDFEAHQQIQRHGRRIEPLMHIDEFAKDPENPTADEIEAVEHLNRVYAPRVDTFEQYFGYPDPRPKPEDGSAPQSPSQ